MASLAFGDRLHYPLDCVCRRGIQPTRAASRRPYAALRNADDCQDLFRRSGSALAKSERCQSARDFPIVTGSRPGLRTRDPSLSGEP
ncbi:hypothetical protein AB1N83_010926 [Pleurotus pulmonarius]